MADLRGVGLTPSFNQSSVSNSSTPCEQVHTSGYVFFVVIYSLVFLVGLILNGFTLKVYFCRPQQLTTSSLTIYLKNLAAADLLVSLCLPTRIMYYASRSIPILQVFCSFGASAFCMNMYASILFMGYIAANRYLKIVHPSRTHILQKVRPAHIISTITWVFLLATASTFTILLFLTQNKLNSVPNTWTCEVLYSDQFSLFYKIAQFGCAAVFLSVLVSLVFFYYSTSRRLSLARQRQPVSSSNKKLDKSRRNMLVLVSVFCVCFVPYHLVRLPYVFLWNQCSLNQVFFYLMELTIVVSSLNVCLDPLIYFIFCKAFRAHLGLGKLFRTAQVPMNEGNNERRSNEQEMSSNNISNTTTSVL